MNAYTKENVHTTCGIDFGQQYVGPIAIVHQALHGLKSSGAEWRSLFASTLHDIGCVSSLADPDVHPATKSNGEHYYEYIFVYVNDILVLSEKPTNTMTITAKPYHLEEGSVDNPTMYLGAIIKEHYLPDNPSKRVWSMSAEQYLKEAVSNLELQLLKIGKQLPNKILTPLTNKYCPKLMYITI